jgi:peptide/nickel transport system permease protein
VLVLASMFAFVIAVNSGDPLGDLRTRPNVPQAVIRARVAELHLNDPFFVRYWHWISHAVRGDFGTNNNGLPVRHIVWTHLLVTARLVSLAIVVAVVLAISVGVISAVRQYSLLDHASTFVAFLLFSLPLFWFAALLKEFLAIRLNNLVGHQWIFTIGDSTPGLTGGFFHNIGNYAGHLVLPTIALAGISYAAYSRFERASMLDVLNSDYVRLAAAKGLPRSKVIVKHALRNALIPFTTYVAIDISSILSGAVITERVFNWQGLGSMLIEAVSRPDVNELLAWLLVTAVIVIAFNLFADLLYGVLDPRIRT